MPSGILVNDKLMPAEAVVDLLRDKLVSDPDDPTRLQCFFREAWSRRPVVFTYRKFVDIKQSRGSIFLEPGRGDSHGLIINLHLSHADFTHRWVKASQIESGENHLIVRTCYATEGYNSSDTTFYAFAL